MAMLNRNPLVRYNYEDNDYFNPLELVFGNEPYNEVIPTVSSARANTANNAQQNVAVEDAQTKGTQTPIEPTIPAALNTGAFGVPLMPINSNATTFNPDFFGASSMEDYLAKNPINIDENSFRNTFGGFDLNGGLKLNSTAEQTRLNELDKIIDPLTQQILGQGLTSKWTGEGYGGAEANARAIAKILADAGITDIKQFGKVDKYDPVEIVGYTLNGKAIQRPNDNTYYEMVYVGETENGPEYRRRDLTPEEIAQVKPNYGYVASWGDAENPAEIKPVSNIIEKDGKLLGVTGKTWGNKETGQAINSGTGRWQNQGGDNLFSGTGAGKGNTGFRVQFGPDGTPYFYTTKGSSNDFAQLLKDLGPIGQIGIAIATGGMSLPAQLATNAGIQLLAGGDLKDIAKGTALSYLGGQAGNLISGSGGITDLLGKTGSDVAANTAKQFVSSGGKADLEDILKSNVIGGGVKTAMGSVPGLDDLTPNQKNMTANLVAAVANGVPIEQAIQNIAVGQAASAARGAFQGAGSFSGDTSAGRTLPLERPQIEEIANIDNIPFDLEKFIGNMPLPQDGDNLKNKAVTDTLETKEGKAMDDIDWSQIGGDFGGNIADLIAKAGSSGNASSIFSGDGGIDLSAFASNVFDEDQAAPPANLDLGKIFYNDTGNPETTWEKFYSSGMQEGLDESNLDNLSKEERARYDAMKSGDTSKYDALVEYLRDRPQDFGGANVEEYLDEFNRRFNPAGGYGSQYQTVGTNRVMINDDGTATVLNPTTNESSYLDEDQVKALIKNGTLNSKASGYVGATGGTGSTPGGSKAATTTAKKATTAASGGSNANLIMALMALMAMMNDRGKSGSTGATIPSLQANRSQLPYSPVSKPGSPNVNYFTPTTYTAKAAEGGLMNLAAGGISDLGGYSDGGRLLRGPGDGVSDSIPATIGGKQPARLATGEFVVPARIVSELGNGSTEAGAKKLYAMMDRVQKARRRTKNVAADTKAHKYLPA